MIAPTRCVSGSAVLTMLFAAAAPARGQTVTWEVSSSFTVTPASGVIGPLTGRHFEHAWAREPARCGVGLTPAGQPETFDPFNADGLILNQACPRGSATGSRRRGAMPT